MGGGGCVQHAVEGGAADAEQLGCAQLVSAAAGEDGEDVLLDDVVQALDVDGGLAGGAGVGGFDQSEQVARLNNSSLGESGGLGDDAFQFAEIVWPEALLELGQGGFGQQLWDLSSLAGDPVQQPRYEDGNLSLIHI